MVPDYKSHVKQQSRSLAASAPSRPSSSASHQLQPQKRHEIRSPGWYMKGLSAPFPGAGKVASTSPRPETLKFLINELQHLSVAEQGLRQRGKARQSRAGRASDDF